MNYDDLDFSREELSHAMREGYSCIASFITSPAFQITFSEMMRLEPHLRPKFVREVWLDSEELRRRKIIVPDGLLIQTSAFGDRRPTLFVVKIFLPQRFHKAWENVNWTFNNDFNEKDVPNDPDSSWRLPLSVSAQNALLEKNIPLESVSEYSDELFHKF